MECRKYLTIQLFAEKERKLVDWETLEAYPRTWKWVLLVCGFLFMMLNFPYFTQVELNFGAIVSGISLIALYGLAYERPVWAHRFWTAFFWVFVVMCAYVVAIIGLSVATNADPFHVGLINGPAESLGKSPVVLLALLVFCIQMRGVYLYAFKRKNLWTRKKRSI